MTWTATREHEIACGHRVWQHESKCSHLHGHNYLFTLHCEADGLDAVGRVIDFSVIKSTLCAWLEREWDHRFLVFESDELAPLLRQIDPSVVVVPFNPTAENIAQHLVEHVAPRLLAGTGVRLVRCEVGETRKCSATYRLGA